MADRVEKMVQRQKEREEAMKARELANKKKAEEARLNANSPSSSNNNTPPARNTAAMSKSQLEREAKEHALEQEKIKRAQEAEKRKKKN